MPGLVTIVCICSGIGVDRANSVHLAGIVAMAAPDDSRLSRFASRAEEIPVMTLRNYKGLPVHRIHDPLVADCILLCGFFSACRVVRRGAAKSLGS